MQRFRWLLVLLLPLVLSACGFHLAGNYLLSDSMKTLYVNAPDPYSALAREVKQTLKEGGVKLIPIPDPRYATLNLKSDNLERRTLSLYPDGQVAEYRLNYVVTAEVLRKDRPTQTIQVQVSRDYLDDPRLALGKSREMEELLSEMHSEAAGQVLRQLATLQ